MTVLGFLGGAIPGAVGGAVVGGIVGGPAGALVGAGAGSLAIGSLVAKSVGDAAGNAWSNAFSSDNDGGSGGGGRKSSSAGKMQKEVERGQAPRSVDRVDPGRGTYEQDHVEFKSGDALNRDGTWKHGGRDLTNSERDWITGHGWDVPQ